MNLYRLILGVFWLALPVALLGKAPIELYPGLNRKWAYYQSPNFELYSANNERESREVLERMELLRALFLDSFKLTVRAPQPVTIYFFDRAADFNGYWPNGYRGSDVPYAGFCGNYRDRTVITMGPSRSSEQTREIVYHEYIHYLFRITEQNPAPWFNEGVAELFSTMVDDKEWLELGHPLVGGVVELRRSKLMSLDDLFAVTYGSDLFKNSQHTGIFYAQSWALLHYCRFGVNKIPKEKMALFLRAAGTAKMAEKPAQFRALCQELLGMDYPELQKALERYVIYGSFLAGKLPRPTIAAKSTYVMRTAPAEEINERLIELMLRVTESPRANLAVRAILENKPDHRLHELMGDLAMREGETEVAREHWLRAVELGTDNAAIYRELGRIESNLLFSSFSPDFQLPVARAAKLRNLLDKSLACAPEQTMGYEMLAWVEATSQDPRIPSLNEVQRRFNTLNDKPRTLLALVLARYRLGDTPGSLTLLDQLNAMEQNAWVAFCAEVTRAHIEKRPVNPAKLPTPTMPGYQVAPPRLALPH